MNLGLFAAHQELSRRNLLRAGAAVGAAGLLAGPAAAASGAPVGPAAAVGRLPDDPADREGDEMFDVEAVIAGAWAPGPYGPDDQRGSFNEVTPDRTAAALRLLDAGRPVKTYGMGEEMFNGFPAYAALLYPRQYEQRLTVLGYVPREPGALVQLPVPYGPNKISAHEERLVGSTTYHIGTQVDGLPHIGVGDVFYNGFRGPDIGATHGVTKLGNEHMGPIVTRGVVVDVVGLKVAQGQTSAYFTADNGRPVLHDHYRITVEDIEDALARQGRRLSFGPGDVVLLRTGWTHLVEQDPERFTAAEPGIYLREARWMARQRPAIIGSDSWALETLDPEVVDGNSFPVHQLLLVKHGIRIGESILTDELVDDGVSEFVFMYSPQNARGATAGCTPPVALAQPGSAEPAS